MFEISSGKMQKPLKLVIYGPEGIGKSSFAAQAPGVLFIDTEGSTVHMDVRRLPAPQSWTMLLQEVDYVRRTPGLCKTLVIDTVDWAERMARDHVCNTHGVKGLEDFGYGKGYVYLYEAIGQLLNMLTDVVNAGMNVILTAHAKMRKFEQPDELGAYDRWEMKLMKETPGMVKEWADNCALCDLRDLHRKGAWEGKKRKRQGSGRKACHVHKPPPVLGRKKPARSPGQAPAGFRANRAAFHNKQHCHALPCTRAHAGKRQRRAGSFAK